MTRIVRLLLLSCLPAWPLAGHSQPIWWLDKCNDGAFMGLELAIDYCTRAIKSGELSNRASGTAYYNRARWYMLQGQHARAAADLSETVRLDALGPEPAPLRAATFGLRGTVYLQLRNYADALADFNEAIRLDGTRSSAWLGRGQVWLARRDADRALADFGQALVAEVGDKTKVEAGGGSGYAGRPRNYDRTSNDSAAHQGRGYAYQLKGDTAAALAAFNEAIRIHPGNVPALKSRAALHERRGDPDGALADYSAAVRLAPRDPTAYYGRAQARALKGEYAQAARDFEATLQLDPRNRPARVARGALAIGEGRYAQAAEDFERLLAAGPPTGQVVLWRYVARARSAETPADRDRAREQLRQDGVKLVEGSLHARLVAYYLGATDAASLRSPGRSVVEACETDYFLAQRRLIEGEQAPGGEMLEAAARQCPPALPEAWAARLELARLQAPR